MKYCKKCKTTKSLEDFNKNSGSKDGRQSRCRDCETEYRAQNKDKIKARSDKYREKNKEWLKERQVVWRSNNKEIIAEMNKNWRKNNPEIEKATKKIYLRNNREKISTYRKKWRLENIDQVRKWHKEHAKEKRATDPQFAIRSRVTTRIREALVKGQKSASSVKLLGCSIAEYRVYIESLFTEGMNWEALLRGEIHLDHKIPCCAFDLTKPEEQHKCFHYTNTQPLWAEDNHKKVGADLKMKKERLGDKAMGNGVSSDNINNLTL